MKKNVGTFDRVIRILLAVAVVVLFVTHVIHAVLAVILFIVAAVLLLTSFVGWCPIYFIFGIRSKKKEEAVPVEPKQ